jgi:hypothetical protein
MKWLPPDGSTQHSADKRYCIVKAAETGPVWIAYRMAISTGEQIGSTNSDELARQLCEDDAALRKRA